MKQLYIDIGIAMTRLGVFENGEIVDLFIDDSYDSSIAGNIYKGRIENIVPGLNAAFVNIGMKKNAFLQLDGDNSVGKLKRGDEMLVQVIREESGDKGPRVTDKLSIPGRCCVLLINDKSINISSKIRNSEKRQELMELGRRLTHDAHGIILRTEAYETSLEDIEEEYTGLRERWLYSEKTSVFLKPPCLIFDAKDITDLVFREYIKRDVEKVYTNSQKLYDSLSSLFSTQGLETRIELAPEPRIYAPIDREIHKAAGRRLELPSGGFVIVDKTEALIVFDVNTGNYSGRLSKEDTVLQTNLEACRCIARAIMINNYSGIILIDFIDMELPENQTLIIQEMTRAMGNDSAKHKVYGITSLGLLEISRARKGKCLRDIIYTQSVHDRLAISSILKALEEECIKRKLYYHESDIAIRLESEAFNEVTSRYAEFFTKLESQWGISVKVVQDDAIEGFQIVK